MATVIFRNASYDDGRLESVISGMMDAVGGREIGVGCRVLIKPNLLIAALPENAVITHPLVVRSIARYALDRGARVQISDSPAAGSFKRLLKEGGYASALHGLPVDVKPFRETALLNIGEPFGSIPVARDAVSCDFLINAAKLKTHSQMSMTLGVKNTFGCIVGLKKPEWHLRAGVDRDLFARLLVQLHAALNVRITLIDGILAMEGLGPGKSGIPRKLGLMAASRSAFAADEAVCRVLGIEPGKIPTCRMARSLGYGGEPVSIAGPVALVSDFKLPEQMPVLMGPRPVKRFLRRHSLQRPVVSDALCQRCRRCAEMCPASAIRIVPNGLDFDYDRCIRCYCCVEVCPEGALRTAEPALGRLIRRMSSIRERIRST